MRALTLAMALALVGSACTAQAPVRGRVLVSSMGPQPVTTLTTDSAGPLVLEGALEPELRRLGGALVEVEGARGTYARERTIELDGTKDLVLEPDPR